MKKYSTKMAKRTTEDYVPLCEEHGNAVYPKVAKSVCEICALREMEKELTLARHEMSQCDDIKLDQSLAGCINDLRAARDHYAEIAKAKETEALYQHNLIEQLIGTLREISERDPGGVRCGHMCPCIGCVARDAIRKALWNPQVPETNEPELSD